MIELLNRKFNFNSLFSGANNDSFVFLSSLLFLLLIIPVAIGVDVNLYPLLLGGIGVFLFSFYRNVLLSLAIFSIFLYIRFFLFQISVILSLFLLVSIILTLKNISIKELDNIFVKSVLIFLVSIFPSYFNSIKPFSSMYHTLNFVALFIIGLTISLGEKDYKTISKLVFVYLIGLFVSTLHVYYQGIATGGRVFGFSEVFYIDLAGIGSLFTVVLSFFTSGKRRIFFSLLSGFYILGLVLTQTRNAWISFILSFFILVFIIYKNSEKVHINKLKIINYTLIVIILMAFAFITVKALAPGVESRVEALANDQVVTNNPVSLMGNSLMTRVLIWHTAINAFMAHPITGIGAYSFPFSSQIYYTIPKDFYLMYVKGLTPHQGYLGVMTETGIVGLAGFIIFLTMNLKLAFRNLRNSFSKEELTFSFMILISLIYVTISLIFTEAWIRGQQAILFGMLLGLSVLNSKILTKNHS